MTSAPSDVSGTHVSHSRMLPTCQTPFSLYMTGCMFFLRGKVSHTLGFAHRDNCSLVIIAHCDAPKMAVMNGGGGGEGNVCATPSDVRENKVCV